MDNRFWTKIRLEKVNWLKNTLCTYKNNTYYKELWSYGDEPYIHSSFISLFFSCPSGTDKIIIFFS